METNFGSDSLQRASNAIPVQLGKQIRFCWLLQENIHIAFNLLGGRPIDFAIFLKILSFSMPVFSVLHLAQQDWYASSQLLKWHCSHTQLWVSHLACSQSHYRTLHPAPLRQWPTLLGPTHLEEFTKILPTPIICQSRMSALLVFFVAVHHRQS